MREATKEEAVSVVERPTVALWGVVADGLEFSRAVGGARSERLLDKHDQRRDQ